MHATPGGAGSRPGSSSMKWVLFVVLFVVVIGGAVAAFFPMSVAADFLAKQERQFAYANATGSVWNGKLTQVRFGDQAIGDVAIKTDPLKLLAGKAAGRFGLKRPEYSGEGTLAYDMKGGEVRLTDVTLSGQLRAVRGLPERIRTSGGAFKVAIDDIVLDREACQFARGEVWTDALAKVDMEGMWAGPELRGPVTCEDGRLVVEATGRAITGEDVVARVDVGGRLDLSLEAEVAAASVAAQEALKHVGFRADGSVMRLTRSIGGNAAAGS